MLRRSDYISDERSGSGAFENGGDFDFKKKIGKGYSFSLILTHSPKSDTL